MDVNELLRGLDPEQREAVMCPPTAIVVHAGAGSGKTRVLTHRIAYRVATQTARAENILAITFTREAAGEMRRRLSTLGVGHRGNTGPTVGTFHAVALALLRQRLTDASQPIPNIVHNRTALATSAAGSHRLAARPRDLLMEIDWAYARMIPHTDYVAAVKRMQRTPPAPAAEIAEIFKQYESLKRKRQIVDLDDLLARVVADMSTDAAYAEAVRFRFKHVFVDEAQDMNPLQYALFDAIRGGRPDVFVVGDPLQAIYGWNGADRMLFDNLPNTLDQVTVLHLPNNYRCSPHIVHAARHAALQTGEEVRIKAVREDGPPVRVARYHDAQDEAEGIAKLLWQYAPTAGAHPWQSCAVLVRTNVQLAAISKALISAGIPIGSTRQPAEITAAIGLAAQCTSRNSLTTWAADILNDSQDDAERTVAEMVRQFVHLDQPGVVDGRAFNAWVVANAVHAAPRSGVDLLTFHAAKGREWDCVVVAGAETGLLPHGSASTNDQRKEEIRLAYVAFTRAAHQLFITYADKRNNRNAGKSPLLDGMPLRADSPEGEQPLRIATRPSNQPNLLDDLTTWRRHTGRATNQEPFQVCTDEVLAQLAAEQPQTIDAIASIFGPLTAQRVAPALLAIITQHAQATQSAS
jgi:DNA helicase-2/ATP-dependent DNA helicase PcrA